MRLRKRTLIESLNNKSNLTVWKRLGNFILTEFDKKILISENEWITDTIINCSQQLLKKEHPLIGGLENVLICELEQVQPCSRKFVQILNENGNHWLTVSNVFKSEKNQVSIYDSLSSEKRSYSFKTLKPVFQLLPDVTEIHFFVEQVTQQVDNSQCGLMSIAFAKALCAGNNPANIQFSDEPITLREHLLKCLEKETIETFPLGSISPLNEFTLKLL